MFEENSRKLVVRITNIPQEILTLVYNEPGITIPEVCKRLKIALPTAHKSVRILAEKYGLIKIVKDRDSKAYKLYPTLGICGVNNEYIILPIIEKKGSIGIVGFQVIFLKRRDNNICCEEFIRQLPEEVRIQIKKLIDIIKQKLEELGNDPVANKIKRDLSELES